MNNKYYILVVGISFGIVVIGFYKFNSMPRNADDVIEEVNNSQQNSTPTQSDITTAPTWPAAANSAQSSSQKTANKFSHLQDRLDAMRLRRPEQQFDPAAVDAAVQRKNTWETAKKIPKNLPLKPEEFTDGRQFIQLDSLKIETLMPGDSVNVNISDVGQNEYNVVVDSVEKQDYNTLNWYGHIDGKDGQTYQVSFTRGEKLTLGGIDTPEGHYVLQAHGNDGWIASSQLLFKIDPNVSDEVYPTEEKNHH